MAADSSDVPGLAVIAANPPLAATVARRGGPVVRLLVNYNPFYLLSACCMIGGLFILNGALDWSPLPEQTLLVLIATLNLYELALVGLGVLLVRRGVVRDGLFVLVLEAFFLADVGFLNMEIFTADPQVGLVVNVLLFSLAVVKVGAVLLLGVRMNPGWAGALTAFVMAQLALLHATPGVFAHLAFDSSGAAGVRGELPAAAVYAAWCALTLVPVLYAGLGGPIRRRWWDLTHAQRVVAKALVAMPFLSMIAHLCLANWVYQVPFHVVNVAPLLLGCAVLVGHWDRAGYTRAARARGVLALSMLAIALSVYMPGSLVLDLGTGGPTLSPLRVVLLGAAAVFADAGWSLRYAHFAVASCACLGLGGMGASVGQMNLTFVAVLRAAGEFLWRLVPKTASQWGVTSVAAAFVLLALGAAVSWLGKALGATTAVASASDDPADSGEPPTIAVGGEG